MLHSWPGANMSSLMWLFSLFDPLTHLCCWQLGMLTPGWPCPPMILLLLLHLLHEHQAVHAPQHVAMLLSKHPHDRLHRQHLQLLSLLPPAPVLVSMCLVGWPCSSACQDAPHQAPTSSASPPAPPAPPPPAISPGSGRLMPASPCSSAYQDTHCQAPITSTPSTFTSFHWPVQPWF